MNVSVHYKSTPVMVKGNYYPGSNDGPVDFDVWTLELNTDKGNITMYFRKKDDIRGFVEDIVKTVDLLGV